MTLGTRLKALRDAKGLGLRGVAKLSGVSASTISRVERDVGIPDTMILSKLAAFYEVSFERVLGTYESTNDGENAMLEGYLAAIAHARTEANNLFNGLEGLARAILAERNTP